MRSRVGISPARPAEQRAAMSQPVTVDHVIAHLANTNAPPIIVMDKVNKWFGSLHVLRDVSLNVAEKERVVVCGPSGSGKSTMIRCINRLETHQEGKIIVDGIELTDDLRALDTIRREVGMVFQSFNLFPHLTILENCTLAPIWVRRMPKAEAEELAMSYLDPCRRFQSRQENIQANSRVGNSSALPSHEHSACGRRSCCSMNRLLRSIRK